MDFPREYYWKRKLNTPQILNFPKPMGFGFNQSLTPTVSKGCIKIEQYEYQQENLLGVGYTSKVYLGHLSSDPRQLFAIKVVDKRKIGKEKQNLALLKQQMEVHQQLDHPNIIKCYRIIEKGYFYYFVLEYCSQGTLQNFIKKHDKLAESTVVTIMEQIISGYRYLMEKKVLHRDLKPANILKSGYTWKICDFGFSVIGKKNMVGDINVGTPSYMAPQALQRTYYSPKTDFFGLGIICYEMLFGNPPWQNKNEKLLLEIMQNQKLDQQKLSNIANKNISDFIKRCCEPIERRRITVKQFQEFSFWNNYDPSLKTTLVAEMMLDIPSRPSSKAVCTTRENSLPTTACPSQTTSYSTAKGLRKELTEQIFSGNNAVIERQLFICQLLYCLVKNIDYFPLLNEAEKDMAASIFTKHAAYIMRRIKHKKLNYLSLKKWEQYIASDSYQLLAQESTNILQRIEQTVKSDNRKKSIVTIRVINRKFDELTYDKHLTSKCINNLKQYVTVLMESIVLDQQKQLQQIKSGGAVQALQYLNKYYGYLGSLSYSCEQSRAIAVSQQYKQRKNLLQNFAISTLGSEDLLKLKEQIENRRL